MSYPKELDEYSAGDLHRELHRRQKIKELGLCDYCGRQLHVLPFCKFPDRHSGNEILEE
jgi:hypothetical protein